MHNPRQITLLVESKKKFRSLLPIFQRIIDKDLEDGTIGA